MKEKWLPILKDIAERAVWTFLQGFILTLATIGLENIDKSAFIAAGMAGFSAVKTFIVDYVKTKLPPPESKDIPEEK